jgi:hypothetical protein
LLGLPRFSDQRPAQARQQRFPVAVVEDGLRVCQSRICKPGRMQYALFGREWRVLHDQRIRFLCLEFVLGWRVLRCQRDHLRSCM